MTDLTPATAPRGPDDRRGRRVRLVVVLVLFFLVAGAVYAAAAKYSGCRDAPDATGASVSFEVPAGATGHDVVARLHEQGLIRCGGAVGDLLLRGTGKADQIRAGTYALTVGMS